MNLFQIFFGNAFDYFDETIYHFLSMHISENLTKFMTIITHMGSWHILLLIMLLTCVIFSKSSTYTPYRGLIVINLFSIWIFNEVLKELFQRDRPNILQLVHVDGYSFPSGHAMISFAFYGLLIFIFCRHLHNKGMRVFILTIMGTLIILIGLSRVYLGVHYASDILAGFLVGFIWVVVLISRFEINGKEKNAYFVK